MIKVKKYAAIDIGSNAMRLLVTNIIEQPGQTPHFNKSALVRVPIRLGQDSFTVGEISEENISRMIDAMTAFQLLMKVHKVEKYMACATSAMREASNGKEVIARVQETSGVKIELIDGKQEAAIIASSDLRQYIDPDKNYLYVDVGGGSTELSVFTDGKVVASRSFKNGTVRLLNESVTTMIWDEMEKWIKSQASLYPEMTIIGSGGNINKLFKMIGKNQDVPLTLEDLEAEYEKLSNMTYDDRIANLGLNVDRADVIIPATRIYLMAMKWSGAASLFVPKIGLSDGIVKAMYHGRL